MVTLSDPDQGDTLPDLRGHVIGFVDWKEEFDAMCQALSEAGFPDSKVLAFHGESGTACLVRMMEGKRWGESAEDVLEKGLAELSHDGFIVCIEVQDDKEAADVAALLTPLGGRNFFHFGDLIDTRLTA